MRETETLKQILIFNFFFSGGVGLQPSSPRLYPLSIHTFLHQYLQRPVSATIPQQIKGEGGAIAPPGSVFPRLPSPFLAFPPPSGRLLLMSCLRAPARNDPEGFRQFISHHFRYLLPPFQIQSSHTTPRGREPTRDQNGYIINVKMIPLTFRHHGVPAKKTLPMIYFSFFNYFFL